MKVKLKSFFRELWDSLSGRPYSYPSVSWANVRRQILKEIKDSSIEVASIPSQNYKEIIEIRVPVRFYWDEDGFDGIEFGEFKTDLQEWEIAMVNKCLEAIQGSIHTEEGK